MFIYFAPENHFPSSLAVMWSAANSLHISSVSRKKLIVFMGCGRLEELSAIFLFL